MWKPNIRKLTGFGAVGAVFAVSSTPAVAQDAENDLPPAASQDELVGTDIVLHVDGMSCPFCAYGLEKRLRKIEAIDDLVIRLSDGLVQIRLVDGAELADDVLDKAVDRAGFSLREIRRLDARSGS